MSCEAWTEPGYGFSLDNGENLGKIKKFILKNSRVYNEIYPNGPLRNDTATWIKTAEDLYEVAGYLNEPLPWVIAAIIRYKEGKDCGIKGYQDDGDTNQDMMLGIEPSYPWEIKYRTREECDAMLKKYAEELGITEEPDYFTAHYCG